MFSKTIKITIWSGILIISMFFVKTYSPVIFLNKKVYIKRLFGYGANKNLSQIYNSQNFYWYPAAGFHMPLFENINAAQPPALNQYICLSWMYNNCFPGKDSAIIRNLYDPKSPNDYKYRNGFSDNNYVQVYHQGMYYEPGIFYYIVQGSGVYINVGKTLIARNKLEALLKLGLAKKDIISTVHSYVFNRNYHSLFILIQQYMVANRLTFNKALLAVIDKAVNNTNYQLNRIADSADYDYALYRLGKGAGYNTIQLTIQPNDNGGWAYELMDLRPTLNHDLYHKYALNQKRLFQRPSALNQKPILCQYQIPFKVIRCPLGKDK